MKNKTNCDTCNELQEKIDKALFTWEIVKAETEMYRHIVSAKCEERAA